MFKVLIDEVGEEGGIGCMVVDVLEIDGVVYVELVVKVLKCYKVGDFVFVKIMGVDGYDLWGEV